MREDEGWNDLHKIGTVARASRRSYRSKYAEEYCAEFEKRGNVVDASLYFSRFQPPVPHSCVAGGPGNSEFNTHRVLIDDVIVRYVEDMHEIAVTVEGDLSDARIEALQRHGLETYSNLERVPYKCVPL